MSQIPLSHISTSDASSPISISIDHSYDAEKQLSYLSSSSTLNSPPSITSTFTAFCNSQKVFGWLAFLPILLTKSTSRFARLLRHNVIGKILLILGSGYIVTIGMLYFFSNDVYPSVGSLKSLMGGGESRASSAGSKNELVVQGFDPRLALKKLKQTPTDAMTTFVWGDWIDLSEVQGFGEESQSGRFDYFSRSKQSMHDFSFPPQSRQTEKEQAFVGKLYLEKLALAPSKIILVGESRATYVVKAEDPSRQHHDYGELDDEVDDEHKVEQGQSLSDPASEPPKPRPVSQPQAPPAQVQRPPEQQQKQEQDTPPQEGSVEPKGQEQIASPEEGPIEPQKQQSAPPSPPPLDELDLETIPRVSQVPLDEEDPKATIRGGAQLVKRYAPSSSPSAAHQYELPAISPIVGVLATGTPEDKVAITLDKSLFKLNLREAEKTNENSTALEIKHAKMIKKARKHVRNSSKHFSEVLLNNDPYGHGTHYDWRFFNLVRHGTEHEAVMHHLIRAWSMFAEQEGIITWISHGSLIGWYWNGISMPWDSDNDVQMPVAELDRFAQLYNGTMVVEDEKEGTGRYYIDVGPWYVQRTRGNGQNVIDARFIDIRSGIYIDITGLAETDRKGQYNCKNYHYYVHDWLTPMRKTLYEGAQVYIPNNYEAVLRDEYNKYRQSAFNNWSFNRDLRLWVPTKKCSKFNIPTKKFDDQGQINMYGACNDPIIYGEYQLTKEVSHVHAVEMEIYNNMETIEQNGKSIFVDTPESRRLFTEAFSIYYPPLRADPGLSMADVPDKRVEEEPNPSSSASPPSPPSPEKTKENRAE